MKYLYLSLILENKIYHLKIINYLSIIKFVIFQCLSQYILILFYNLNKMMLPIQKNLDNKIKTFRLIKMKILY